MKLPVIILLLVFIVACGNNKQNAEKSVIIQPDKSEIVQIDKSDLNSMKNHPGKKVYNSVCLACHMRDGSGVPGMHPPLIESEFINGDPDKLIKIVLEGLTGEMEIEGEVYNSIMPAQANLTDQQIADVLTFVRGSFGNNSGEISPEEVQKLRTAK